MPPLRGWLNGFARRRRRSCAKNKKLSVCFADYTARLSAATKGMIHENTRNNTNEKKFRVRSCDFVDRGLIQNLAQNTRNQTFVLQIGKYPNCACSVICLICG